MTGRSSIHVRLAREDDLDAIVSMTDEFAEGHPAEAHARPRAAYREAYFGGRPAAEIVVAEQAGEIVGMSQWSRIFDMFWATWAGRIDWLYVRPAARRLAVFPAMLALICDRVRADGGRFVTGQANRETGPLYARCAIEGTQYTEFHLSQEAFERLADLAGHHPREIVQALPEPDLNFVARKRR